jgi:transcriptional regulator with XRE-family HTH domain
MGRVVDQELARISQRIRASREAAGLTLQELAGRSGVATSTIQKVEKEQMTPSVAVILKIARGLGVRLSELVVDTGDELEILYMRASERHPIGAPGKLVVERLSGDLFEPALETWRVTLHPGYSSGRGTIQYEGEELLIGERGVVTFQVGDREYLVRAGDTLHFKASIPHSWRNDGDTPARFIVTGTLPKKFRAMMHGRVANAAPGPQRDSR